MTKIEELIESIRGKQPDGWLVHQDFQDFDIEEIMQKYAEFYASETLQAFFDDFTRFDDVEEELYFNRTFPPTFLNSYELPTHV